VIEQDPPPVRIATLFQLWTGVLRRSSMSIDQIAQVCGFQSQHHLIRSFKKATSQTPGAYRKARAASDSSSHRPAAITS
jgi:AraC-like DNA-binding protein